MKRWTPYYFAIPLTEGEIPMDKGGFRTVTDKSLSSALEAVVYCKDCKHRDPEDHKCDCGHDIQWQLPRQDNWFCADGVAKDINVPDKEGW